MTAEYEKDSPAARAFVSGKKAVADRQYRRAAISFLSAIRAAPEVRAGWDQLAGTLELMRRRTSEAVIRRKILQTFGLEGPESLRSLQRLASHAFLIGDYSTADAYLSAAFRLNSHEPKWFRNLVWLRQTGSRIADNESLLSEIGKIRELTADERKIFEYRARNRSILNSRSGVSSGAELHDCPLPKKLRVAVLISGQLRDYTVGLQNIRDNLARPLKADVFVHSWASAGVPRLSRALSPDLTGVLKRAGLPTNEDLVALYPFINQVFGSARPSEREVAQLAGAAKVVLEDEPASLRESRSIGHVSFPEKWKTYSVGSLPMFYKLKQCFDLMVQYENEKGFKYDVVIRVRPDLIFPERVSRQIVLEAARSRALLVSSFNIDHCDDQFAVGSRDVMERYSSVFLRLPDYWGDRGEVPGATLALGENLLFQHLYYEGIDVSSIQWGKPASLLDRKITVEDMMTLSQRRYSESNTEAAAKELVERLAEAEA